MLLGIQAGDSELIIADIARELSTVRDLAAFVEFCKDNFQNYQYLNGYQKFLALIRDYQPIEDAQFFLFANKKSIDKIKSDAYSLQAKIKAEAHNIITADIKGNIYTANLTGEELKLLPYSLLDCAKFSIDSNYVAEKIIDTEVEKLKTPPKTKEIKFNFSKRVGEMLKIAKNEFE
jgi:hypothetical protein